MSTEAPAKPAAHHDKKQSTKPGDPAPAAKKEDVPKVCHPALKPNDKGEPTEKLDEWPADFDPRKHVRLKPENFKNEAPFYEHLAKQCRERAARYDKQAVLARTMGSAEERKNAKKLIGLADKMQEIRASLIKAGHDPDKMFAAILEQRKAQAAAEAPTTTG